MKRSPIAHKLFVSFILDQRPAWVNYLIALVLAMIATLCATTISTEHLGSTLIFPFASAVLASLIGGTGPGVLASLVGAIGLDFFVLGPGGVLENRVDIARFATYLGLVLLISPIIAQLRTAYFQTEQLKEQAENARTEAERQSRARENVLNVVSHDLRNPLSNIQLIANLFLSPSLSSRAGDPREAMDRILRSADRMRQIIGDLLDAGRIERGQFSIHERPEEIDALIDEALFPFQSLAESQGVRVRKESSLQDARFPCDHGRVIQALSNLLHNALKFSPREGTITVRTERNEGFFQISVSDEGPGIPPEALSRVFERYWTSGETNAEGTGLGLFISRGIALSHGGDLKAMNNPQGGATFILSLPTTGIVVEKKPA